MKTVGYPVGYVGIKDTKGTIDVCAECVEKYRGKDWGAHSWGTVYSSDIYITRNGGMRCDNCQEKFI